MPEIGAHQLEVAETLIGVGRFLVIFVAARLLAELLVRWQLPTILGELIAGVIIGASGLHLIVPPETQAALSQGLVQLVGSLADVPPDVVSHLYAESFPSLAWRAILMSWWPWADRPPRWRWPVWRCPLPWAPRA